MSSLSAAPQTLFRCDGARLVKHVPSVPTRVNGGWPRNPIDAYGPKGSRDLVLADWTGTLYLDTVQDPFAADISTLVLSIDLSGQESSGGSFGAARRCVLPFRSFSVQDAGAAITGPKAPPVREVYLGLTSLAHGDGAHSLWFYEDTSERGARERATLEAQGAGRRALWTCFIPGTWSQFDRFRFTLERFPLLPDAEDSLLSAPTQRASRQEQNRLSELRKSLFLDAMAADGAASVEPGQPLAPTRSGFLQSQSGTQRSVALKRQLEALRFSQYRNSLIAVDNETGDIVAVVATNVHLRANDALSDLPASSSSDEGSEAVTPAEEKPQWALGNVKPASSIIRPASRYCDPDDSRLRPSSRAGSVLKEDTFAPAPAPISAGSRSSVSDAADFFTAAESATSDADGDQDSDWTPGEDGLVRLALNHEGVEAHRPDLLRDLRASSTSDPYDSDASGSTEGGPALRLWRKARGKRKTTAKKPSTGTPEPAEFADAEKTPRPSVILSPGSALKSSLAREATDPPLSVAKADTPRASLISLAPEECSPSKSKARRDMLRSDEVRRAEDGVWSEALDSGELPLDAAYTHLHSVPTNTSVEPLQMSDPMQASSAGLRGGTVLLEFLAGSRIGAKLVQGSQVNVTATPAPAKTFIPVLPMHMLWFLGIANERTVPARERPQGGPVSLAALGGLVNLSEKVAASAAASSNALLNTSRDLWSGLTGWTSSASSWVFGDAKDAQNESDNDAQSSADAEADREAGSDDGTLVIPYFDPESWGATPRPVFRRRRPTPSFVHGFSVGPQAVDSKYSILHVDNHYNPRDVYLQT